MSALTPLLTRDSFTHKRPVFDSEGEPNGFTNLGTKQGTWGSPSSRDQEIAGRLDQVVDAVLGTTAALEIEDRVEGLRGSDWRIFHWHETQVHRRYFLQKVG